MIEQTNFLIDGDWEFWLSILTILFLLLLSAFFSGSETALLLTDPECIILLVRETNARGWFAG